MVDWYIDPILIINFTILNYPMQKSNAYLLSPIAPSLSPVKSETDINKTTLCQLFSKQFLGRVKQQLQVRSPKSKTIQSQHKQCLLQIKTQKQEILKLKQIIENLTKQNQELQNKLDQQEGTQEEQSAPQMIVHHPKLARKLSIMKTQNGISLEQIENNENEEQQIIEIQGLKGKIQKLETLKSIKDQRINQLLEKQLRFTSQIKLLQHKNEQLKEELYVLRSTIQYTLQKPLKNTTNSQIDPSISIKIQHQQQYPNPYPPLPSGLLSINNHQDSSLIVSCTANVMIPDSLTLSKAYKKFDRDSCSSFNQIDYMISQELPYVSCSSEISLEGMKIKPEINLNQSLIAINLNQF